MVNIFLNKTIRIPHYAVKNYVTFLIDFTEGGYINQFFLRINKLRINIYYYSTSYIVEISCIAKLLFVETPMKNLN